MISIDTMTARILTGLLLFFGITTLLAQAPTIHLGPGSMERVVDYHPPITHKAVPELIRPVTLTTESCTDTSATVYQFTADNSVGYPFGSGTVNGFNLLGTIQRFIYPSQQPYQVSEVGVAFAVADSSAFNQRLSARIYNDLNADSTFGTLLAISDNILVSEVLLPDSGRIQYTTFTFPDPAVLDRDSFLVYIDASDIYEGFEGDVAIISTTDSCGFGRNALVDLEGSGNRFIGSVDQVYGLEAELYMTATVDTTITSSLFSPIATTDYAAEAFPNPGTSAMVTIAFTTLRAGQYTISMVDARGCTIRQQRYPRLFADQRVSWELKELPTGLFIYRLDGPGGRQSGKVVVH